MRSGASRKLCMGLAYPSVGIVRRWTGLAGEEHLQWSLCGSSLWGQSVSLEDYPLCSCLEGIYIPALMYWEQRQEARLENRLSLKCLGFGLASGSPSAGTVSWVWGFSGSGSLKNTFLVSWQGWSRVGVWLGRDAHLLCMQTSVQGSTRMPRPGSHYSPGTRRVHVPSLSRLCGWLLHLHIAGVASSVLLSELLFLMTISSPQEYVGSSHSLLLPPQFSLTWGFSSF